MPLRIVCLLLIGLILAGCSCFFPTDQKPETNILDNWNSKNSNIAEKSEGLPGLVWWKKFNDPVLNKLIDFRNYALQKQAVYLLNMSEADG